MKAMILAAGNATRLGELGAEVPKCMLPLGGRHVLEWTIESLREAGVVDLVINVHRAPQVITRRFGDGSAWSVRIRYTYELEPLGTAGGVHNARSLLEDDEPFLVIYGDTILDWDPVPAIRAHRACAPMATIAVAQEGDPRNFGVVQFDSEYRIEEFLEKPIGWRGQAWVNAGLYVLDQAIFPSIAESRAASPDFGKDIFPALLSKGHHLRAYPRPGALLPIDTPGQYFKADSVWTKGRRS